ncbi:MAG: hypothetical protein M1817_003256 [Caeruleum heppii]|nr:MAG: hypothetical protein M1817_003256 [Caeruleum heppii]
MASMTMVVQDTEPDGTAEERPVSLKAGRTKSIAPRMPRWRDFRSSRIWPSVPRGPLPISKSTLSIKSRHSTSSEARGQQGSRMVSRTGSESGEPAGLASHLPDHSNPSIEQNVNTSELSIGGQAGQHVSRTSIEPPRDLPTEGFEDSKTKDASAVNLQAGSIDKSKLPLQAQPVQYVELSSDLHVAAGLKLPAECRKAWDDSYHYRVRNALKRHLSGDRLGSLECLMAGVTGTRAAMRPTILIMCLETSDKRLIEQALSNAGFEASSFTVRVVTLEVCKSSETAQSEDTPNNEVGRIVEARLLRGNPTLCGVQVRLLLDELTATQSPDFTIGGLLSVKGSLFGLTTAHAFTSLGMQNCRTGPESIPGGLTSQEDHKEWQSDLALQNSPGFTSLGSLESYAWGRFEVPPNFANPSGEDIKATEQPMAEENDDSISMDWALIRVAPELCVPNRGDSGSWVLRDAKVCGYIFCRVKGLPWAYMIPIEAVLQAIATTHALASLSDISFPSSDDLRFLTPSQAAVKVVGRPNTSQSTTVNGPTSQSPKGTMEEEPYSEQSRATPSQPAAQKLSSLAVSAADPLVERQRGSLEDVIATSARPASGPRGSFESVLSPAPALSPGLPSGSHLFAGATKGDQARGSSRRSHPIERKSSGLTLTNLEAGLEYHPVTEWMHRPPFEKDTILLDRWQERLPGLRIGQGTSNFQPQFNLLRFVTEELAISDSFNPKWMPLLYARLRLATYHPLHHQHVLKRRIILTEDARLHLMVRGRRIYLKPLPLYLLDYNTWADIICSSSSLYEDACGFLLSYTRLLCHESDFDLAQEFRLLDRSVSWPMWLAVTRSILSQLDKLHISSRYVWGELQFRWLVHASQRARQFVTSTHFSEGSRRFHQRRAIIPAAVMLGDEDIVRGTKAFSREEWVTLLRNE